MCLVIVTISIITIHRIIISDIIVVITDTTTPIQISDTKTFLIFTAAMEINMLMTVLNTMVTNIRITTLIHAAITISAIKVHMHKVLTTAGDQKDKTEIQVMVLSEENELDSKTIQHLS